MLKNTRVVQKLKKPWAIGILIFIILLVILFSFQSYLNNSLNRLSGEILKTLIENESDGKYTLNYENLDVYLLRKNLSLTNASIQLDSSRAISMKDSAIYFLSIDSLNIRIRSMWKLIFHKQLLIKGIQLFNPHVKMIRPGKSFRKFNLETGDFYELISHYLEMLRIDFLKVQDGKFIYGDNKFSLDKIDFNLENFFLDPKWGRKGLNTDQIDLTIRNQLLLLPDSLHILTFEEFGLSTKDSVLYFKNLSLKPRNDIAPSKSQELNFYNITIPMLQLKGIDYLRAYKEGNVLVKDLIVDHPKVNVKTRLETMTVGQSAENNLVKILLTNVFDSISLQHLFLKDVKLNLSFLDNPQKVDFQNADLELFKVHFDSTNYAFDKKGKYFDGAKITINNYQYDFWDSIHHLSLAKFDINTYDSTMEIEGLDIKPVPHLKENTSVFHLTVPHLKINKVNFLKALKNEQLLTGDLTIDSPSLKILNISDTNNISLTPQQLLEYISPLFNTIKSQKIILKECLLNVADLAGIKANIVMEGINLDNTIGSWHQLAKRSKFRLEDFWLKNKQSNIYIERIHPDEKFKNISISNAKFQNQNINGNLRYAKIYNFMVDSLLTSNKLMADSVRLRAPDVEITLTPPMNNKDKNEIPQWFQQVSITDGKLKLIVDQEKSILVNNLNTTFQTKPFTKIVRLNSSSLQLTDSKTLSNIHIEKAAMTTKGKKLTLKDVQISSKKGNNLTIAIPEISAMNWDQKQFWKDQKVAINQLIIQSPKIQYKPKIKNAPILVDIPYLKVNSLLVKNGSVVYKKGDFFLRARNWDFDMNRFDLPNGDFKTFLQSKPDFTLDILDLLIREKKDSLFMLKTNLNGKTGNLNIGTLVYRSQNNDIIAADNAFFTNLDFYKLIADNDIIAGKLEFKKPICTFYLQKENEENSSPVIPNLPHIKLDEFTATQGNFIIYKKEKKYKINDLSFTLKKINLERSLKLQNLVDQVGKVNISAGPLSYTTADGLNTITVDKYTISYPENEIKLFDVKLTPLYSRKAYVNYIDNQQDRVKFQLDQLTLKQFDFDLFLKEDKIHIGNVLAENLDLDVYRDKNVPRTIIEKKELPQSQLKSIDQEIWIDSLTLHNGNFSYTELPEGARKAGTVTFDSMDGQIKNIHTGIKPSVPVIITGTGKLMNAGKFNAKLTLFMDDPENKFRFSGQVGPFQLSEMNSVLGPIANLEIKSGENEMATFNYIGNDVYAEGTMLFNYNDLKIRVLNPKTQDRQGLEQGFITFFANTFLVRRNNYAFPKLREGVIFYKRDQTKAIFNFLNWSLMSGLINSVGIQKNEREMEEFKD